MNFSNYLLNLADALTKNNGTELAYLLSPRAEHGKTILKEFRNPTDLLKHVLEPSLRIEDRYATYTLTLASGNAVTGMIVEEKDGVVKLIENPLASAKPLEIKAGDIETRKKAATSMMPKGLLDKLTKDEVLDLLAYVWAKGDPKHRYFQGGHDHGGHQH